MRRIEKLLRVLIVVLFIFTNSKTSIVSAADPLTTNFAGFNQPNITFPSASWNLAGSVISGSSILMTGDPASATFILDISSIAASVNLEHLKIDFSTKVFIADEADLDSASVVIGFSPTSSDPVTIPPLERGLTSPDTALPLTSNASIPTGTKFLFVTLQSIIAGSENTAAFSELSLKIMDEQVPTLTHALTPTGWTNTNVGVSFTATDEISGIEGIYDSSDQKVTSFTATENGTWQFKAKDYAGNFSTPIDVVVNNIDNDVPGAPTLTPATTAWSNTAVEFTVTASVPGSSPETLQFRTNGDSWQTYVEPTSVSAEGETTLEARTIDAATNASVVSTATIKIDQTAPIITLTSTPHEQPLGGATITVDVAETLSGLAVTKWAAGTQIADYFSSAGTDLAVTTIDVVTGGIYTFFAKDNAGNATIKEVIVNTFPTLDTISDQTILEDGTLTLSLSIGDGETAVGELIVKATSSNTTLFPSINGDPLPNANELVLTPSTDLNGNAKITVSVQDTGDLEHPEGLITEKNFNVTVSAVNDPPIAVADLASGPEDGTVEINALVNDTDVDIAHDGDSLSIVSTTTGVNGTITIVDGTKIDYAPNKDWSGVETFNYSIQDSKGVSASSTVKVTIASQNDDPIVSDISNQTVNEDTSTAALLFTATDVDPGTTLIVTGTSSNLVIVPLGNISIDSSLGNGNYTVQVTPALDKTTWNSVDSKDEPVTITIRVNDGTVIVEESFTLSVVEVNDPPEVGNDSVTIDEGEQKEIDVLFNDRDAEGGTLQITDAGNPAHGSVAITSSGTKVTYTPNADYNGSDSFIYTVSDGSTSTTGTVTITITNVNDAPVAVTDELSMNEDGVLPITPLSNDTDADLNNAIPDQLVITGFTQPAHGIVAFNEVGLSLTYTPTANWYGSDTFTYSIKDSSDATATGTINITVQAVNDGPVAVDDSVTIDEDTVTIIDVLANDNDADNGDTKTFVSFTQPTNGIVAFADNSTKLQYTPTLNSNGSDSFTYIIKDSKNVESNVATVTVNVTAVDDAPVIVAPINQTIEEDHGTGKLSFTVSDVEPDTLSVSAVSDNQGVIPDANIAVLGTGSCTIEINPESNKNTWDGLKHTPVNITITASDGFKSTTAVFTVTVNPVNDDPSAVGDSGTVAEDTSVIIEVLSNDTDIESNPLTVSGVGSAAHGSVTIAEDHKSVTYTPVTNYNGSDSFTYTASDGNGGSSTATVSITVTSVNDAPVAATDTVSLNEDVITTINVVGNDTDVDMTSNPGLESITIDSVTDPVHGTTEISENKIIYTPDLNYNGTDTFTYTVKDQSDATATGTVNLTVNPVNDFPSFSSLIKNYTVNEDNSITINFNIADVETPTESLMLQVTSGTTTKVPNSRLELGGLGNTDPDTSLKITPVDNANGDVVITLRLGDGFVVTVETFTLHITPVNDDPVAYNNTINFTEDQSIVIDMDSLLTNDTDIDLDTKTFVSVDKTGMLGTLVELSAIEHTYTYTPPANFDQNTTFQYTMTDGTANDSATVTLHAIAVNDAPTIVMDGANPTSVNEDTDITLSFTIHDQETTISTLTVVAGSSNTDILAPANISINCNASGLCSLVAHPNPNKNGDVTITASVSDGVYLISTTAPITFTEVADAPSAVNDTYSIGAGGSQIITPLENDYDVDGDTISITSVNTTDMTGLLTPNGGGSYTYTPPAHFVGPQTFTYTITDSTSKTSTATVTLTGGSVNTAPTISRIVDQSTMEDTTSAEFSFTVSDPEADAITITPSSSVPEIVASDATHIVVVKDPAIAGKYTVKVIPAANAFGVTNITLTANDGALNTAITFKLTVYPVNDEPIIINDTVTTNEDTAIVFNPVANDTDIELSTLTIVEISTPAHGTLSRSGVNYTYTPNANYHGIDNLTYKITDGESVVSGTITITVNSVNDTPVARDDWPEVSNTIGANATITVLQNDDSGGDASDPNTVSIESTPTYGFIELVGNQIKYTRDDDSGDSHDSFVYRITDSGTPGLYSTATVHIAASWGTSINAENVWDARNEDSPQFTLELPISTSVPGGHWTLSWNDSTVTPLISDLGTATLTPGVSSNTITFTPKDNAFGSETLQYKVTSNEEPAKTDTAYIYITLYPVNDLPEISAVADQTINEDTTTASLSVTISDVDNPVADLKYAIYSGDQTLVSNDKIITSRTDGTITFTITPILNRNGLVTIHTLASDSVGFAEKTFDLNVLPINDAPVAVDYAMSLSEDSSKTITVIPPFADVENDPLTLTISTPPTHGTILINGDKTVTYTPYANYCDVDSFVYQLDDGALGGVDAGTVSITVTPVNDGPVISNLVYLHETSEDTPKNVTFTVSDIDNEIAELQLSFVSGNTTILPAEAISLPTGESNKTITLTPSANLSGESIITVQLSDGSLFTEQQFKLVVNSINDPPVANDDSASTDEDTAVTINVFTNDNDVEDLKDIDVASVTTPGNGSVVNNRDGTIKYSPKPNWYGTDTFVYTVIDQNDATDTATVTVTVSPINDAPNAVNDSNSINEDVPILIKPLLNDSDVEGDTISLTGYTNPGKGALQDNKDGTFTFTPTFDVSGSDSFTYTISDGLLSSIGMVSISITAVNDAPRLTSSDAAPWTMNEDTPTSFPINIYDPETASDNLVIKITSSDQTLIPDTSIHLQGSGADKTLLLTPNLNKFGTLDITIEATDGELITTKVFPVEILSVNDLPTISDTSNKSIPEDSTSPAYTFTVYDIETLAADLSVTAHSANGTLIPDSQIIVTPTTGGNRTVQITPAANLIGNSLITLTVHDADSGTASDSFTMTVTPVNDPPVASADPANVNEDAFVSIDVLANDSDVDLANEGDDLTIVSYAAVDNGTVVIATDKKLLTFTPSANWNGTEVFTYTIRDIAGATASASVTVTVAPVNDPPAAVDDTAATSEETPIKINVLTNDTDIDLSREGDNLTVTVVSNATHGTPEITDSGKTVTFTPSVDFSGDASFDYTIEDKNGITSSAHVVVTVSATNDPPVISDITDKTIVEDGNSGAISFTVTDVDTAADLLIVSKATVNGAVIPTSGISVTTTGNSRTVTITPVSDKNTWGGVDNPILITLTVSDGALTDSDTFYVSVTPVNDPPVAVANSISTNEDTSVNIPALANDSDVDIANEGDSISITSFTGVDNGAVQIIGGTSLRFTPNPNWNGTEIFSYTITDSHDAEATANVTVTVNAVNDAPTIAATADQTINEDFNTGAIAFTINDVDAASTLTVTGVSNTPGIISTANVVVSCTGANCTVTVTPLANKNTWNKSTLVNDPVTITLTVKDATNLTATDTFTVTVLKVNDGPVAINDSKTIPEDGSSSIDVLANDTDIDLENEGDTLTIKSVANVDNGVVVIADDKKSLTFTPFANWADTETFDYTIQDLAGLTSTASVTVTVSPVNDPPTISDIPNQSINEDSNTGDISFTVNDIDNLPTTLTTVAVSVNQVIIPDAGAVINGSGADRMVKVTPALNRNTYVSGPILVTVTVTDSGGLTASDTFTMTVIPLNDAPLAVNDSVTMEEDGSKQILVLINDTDSDLDNEGDHLSILSTAGVHNDWVSIAGDKKSLTFTPPTNWVGVDTFTYTIRDDADVQSTANVTVTVTDANDAPVAVNDSSTTNEDTPITVDVLANDTDADTGDILTVFSTTGVDNGSVKIADDNKSLTFTPAANWNGSETFTYTVRDSVNASASASVTITVNAINDGPNALADALSIAEDQTTTVTVLSNDTDVDLTREGDTLVIVAKTDPDLASGTITIAGDNKSISFDPTENWYGTASFTYTIEDKGGLQSTASVNITVNSANDGPVAVADNTSTIEDTSVTIDVLHNDTDVDLLLEGDDLVILSRSGVDHGSVTIATDNKTLTFNPAANWNGTEVFNYIVEDKAHAQATASVTVTVSGVNDNPVANDDSTTTNEDTPVLFNAIANDTDVDLAYGDNLTLFKTIGVDHGVTTISEDKKSILFTPDLNWTGTEVFTYMMNDKEGKSDTADFTVVVNPINDAPKAVNDAVTIDEDHTVSVDVLTNDSDSDFGHEGDNLIIKSVSGVDHGSVTIAADFKSLSFTPSANWNGSETFAYVIKDKANVEATANVTITVNPVNDLPLAVDDTLSTNEDVPLVMDLLINDTDVDLQNESDNLLIISLDGVDHGTATLATNKKNVTFAPAANWNGSEEFTYKIQDKSGNTSTAKVFLTVVAQVDASVANPDAASVDEEGSVVVNVLANDVEGDVVDVDKQLVIESVSGVDHGIVTIASDSLSLSFAPSANWAGTEVFYYTMKDRKNATSTTTVTMTVIPINDPPIAVDDHVSTIEDTAGNILALSNDTDVDIANAGDVLKIISLGLVQNGAAVISSDGKSILFTPAANWNGDTTFSYTMEDKAHLSSTAKITVTVTPVNDSPVLADVPDQTMDEDTTNPIAFTLSDADTAAANLTLTATSSNEQIVANSNLVFGGSGDNRTLTITPQTNMNTYNTGPITITLTASDGTITVSDVFYLIVNPVNDAPVATADSTRLNEDTTVTINPLANDTDIDLANEGDEISILNVSGVDHASVQITNSGKALLIAPSPNWFGTEVFQYTITDRGGLQATANVTVVVDDVPEKNLEPITDPSFMVTSPKAGEKFKDGQTIHVTWTKANLPGVSYQLQFFDGVSWSTLANGLKSTEYDHKLENTKLHTNAARYQVVASSTNPQSLLAVGEFFIIDNLPPRDVQISLTKSDRSVYTPGLWTNLPVDVVVSGGWDLTGIELKLYDGSKLLGSNGAQLGARISTQGDHLIKVIAVDPLGNQMTVSESVIKIDLEPPAAPALITAPTEGVTTGGSITFAFSDDPGLSGNDILILPDGTEVKIDGDFTWNSVQDGVYTFITIDLAGNRRTLVIAVTGGEMTVQEDTTALPDIAPPDGAVTIDESTVQSEPVSNTTTGSGSPLRSLGILVSGLLLGFLLIILLWPNVKIIYSYRRSDGKVRKVTHFKRVFTPDDKKLKIKVKDADSYEIIFSRSMTRSMRGGSLTLEPKKVNLSNPLVEVPDNEKHKFTSSFWKII